MGGLEDILELKQVLTNLGFKWEIIGEGGLFMLIEG